MTKHAVTITVCDWTLGSLRLQSFMLEEIRLLKLDLDLHMKLLEALSSADEKSRQHFKQWESQQLKKIADEKTNL